MKKFLFLLFSILVIISVVIFFLGQSDLFTSNTLWIANAIIAMLTFISYFLGAKGVHSDNNNRFVRGVMGGTFLKFFLVLVIGTLYLVLNKGAIKVPNIVAMMFMYVIYTTVETAFLAKQARSI